MIKEMTPEEVRAEYLSYNSKRKASRPFHRDGDTAVIGARHCLSIPYWISVVLQKDPNWKWVLSGKKGMQHKFKKMFPEFAYENKQKQIPMFYMFDDEFKATAYLYQRLKDNRIITVAVNPK